MAQRKVTAIPATKSRFTETPINTSKKRRVAAYARVSTDHEEQQTSYEAQVDYYTNYIKSRDDWEFVGTYTDEGISATSTKRREGFKTMVADALAGKIDLIVTKSVSRFARNTVDSLSTIRQLKEHGTEVYFEKENIWTFDGKGELLITIMSSLAQEESRSISENCTWGQRKRFADGKVTVPFSRFLGYDRGSDGNLVVNKEQAVIVRRIYRLFLEGKTPRGIANLLTQEGVPTPGGKKTWSGTTVRSILSNEKYVGDAMLQKSYTVDYLSKKKKLNEGEIPQYYVRDNHEAIIDHDTFDMVQKILGQQGSGKNRHSGVHMFSGRIKCACCGSWYGSKVWHSNDKYRRVIWQCNHKFDGGEKCDTPHLTEDEIKERFISAANQLFQNRDNLIADIDLVVERLYDIQDLEDEQQQLLSDLDLLVKQTELAINENARTALDQVAYRRHYDELVARYDAAKEKLDAVTAEIERKEVVRATLSEFRKTLLSQETLLDEFDEHMWYALLDYATVYDKDDVRFTFRNGIEIRA